MLNGMLNGTLIGTIIGTRGGGSMENGNPADGSSKRSRVLGAAGIIMFATLLSRVTGFLRTMLIYTVMGPKGYSDQFLYAFGLSDIAFNLLAGGAIAAAIIPVMSALISKDRQDDAWKALSTFLNLSVLALLVLEVVFLIWTEALLPVLVPGYARNADPEDRKMVVTLTRILLLNVPFMMLAGQCNGILNSYKRFAAAAFGPVVYNLCTILGIALFGGKNVYLTSWMIVASAGIFFVLQMWSTRHAFRRYRPRLELRHPAFRRMLRQAVPSLASSTLVEINNVMARSFASFMQSGMTTLLNNANRTWQLPMGIFAQSIGIAMLPSLSAHYAARETDAFRSLFNRGMRAVFLISLPLSVILLLEGDQVMRLLFKWGDLPESDVFHSGLALMGYSAALLFASLVGMTIRAFYAIHDSVTPLLAGLAGIGMNYLFNALFRQTADIGIAGTALAYSFSSFLQMMVLLLIFSRKTGILFFSDNIRFFGVSALATIPSGLVLWLLTRVFRPDPDNKLSQIVCAAIPALACLLVFYVVARALRIAEVSLLRDMVAGKLSRIRRRGGAQPPRA